MNGDFDDVHEEDIEVIPPDAEEEEKKPAASADTVLQLEQSLDQKTRESKEANEKYLRAAADFENYRKRMQRDLTEFRKYANEQLALELLPVVDHLALALKHSRESGDAVQGLQQGVELVFKQLRDALEKFGIKPFESEGQPFDPARHDAMMQVVTDEVPENTVVQVMQEGYMYYDKVLRHAKVGVSKKPEMKPDEQL